MAEDIRARVIEIIAVQALRDPSRITEEMTLESLGIDSLGLVEAVFAIEESFDVSVPFNASAPGTGGFDISSVGAIARAVEALVAAKAG